MPLKQTHSKIVVILTVLLSGLPNVLVSIEANAASSPLETKILPIWDRTFGGSSGDSIRAIAPSTAGGYLLAGLSASPVSGNKGTSPFGGLDAWVVKVDDEGNKQWEALYGGTDSDYFVSAEQTSDGGYILGGSSASPPSGNKTTAFYGTGQGGGDLWVVKINGIGKKLWERSFGGNDRDDMVAVRQLPDGGYVVAGWSRSGASGNKASLSFGHSDYWLIRLDSAGDKIWEKHYGGSLGEELTGFIVTVDGGFVLGGLSQSGIEGNKTAPNHGEVTEDYWIVRTDPDGNIIWDKTYGGTGRDWFGAVVQTTDGGYLLGGTSLSLSDGNKTVANFGNGDCWVVRIDSGGGVLWDKAYGGNSTDYLFAILPTPDGGFLLGGNSTSPVSGNKTSPWLSASLGIGDIPHDMDEGRNVASVVDDWPGRNEVVTPILSQLGSL